MYPQAVLSFTLPDGEKKSVPLRPNDPVLIGRNRASTIKLNLPSVSRQHAKIIYERDVFWIEDLGSSNGTFVNQKQVQKARINIGDVLKCGDFVIAVRNHSDRISISPNHQHDNRKLSDPPPIPVRSPIGQRRDSLKPSQPSVEVPKVSPWHSKAPTHGPDANQGQRSAAPVARHETDARSITSLPRTESLSIAFGDTKPKEPSQERGSSHLTGRGPTQQVTPQFMQTADDPRDTELSRLKRAEDSLLNEVNFQTQQIQALQQQIQESNERIVSLESDLDQKTQQYEELRVAIEHSGQDADQSLKAAELEIERLQNEQSEFLKERSNAQQKYDAEKLENTNHLQKLQKEFNEAQAEMTHLKNQELQNDVVAKELESLKVDYKRLLADQEIKRDQTEMYVFSLAEPNRNATKPDWAKFKAKQELLIDEIHHLRGLVERLKQDSNVNRNTLIDKPSLLERVNLEDNQDVESEQTMNQEPYDSISKGSQANENLNSSSNIRRTWRGML